jgi:hypothetical protein
VKQAIQTKMSFMPPMERTKATLVTVISAILSPRVAINVLV